MIGAFIALNDRCAFGGDLPHYLSRLACLGRGGNRLKVGLRLTRSYFHDVLGRCSLDLRWFCRCGARPLLHFRLTGRPPNYRTSARDHQTWRHLLDWLKDVQLPFFIFCIQRRWGVWSGQHEASELLSPGERAKNVSVILTDTSECLRSIKERGPEPFTSHLLHTVLFCISEFGRAVWSSPIRCCHRPGLASWFLDSFGKVAFSHPLRDFRDCPQPIQKYHVCGHPRLFSTYTSLARSQNHLCKLQLPKVVHKKCRRTTPQAQTQARAPSTMESVEPMILPRLSKATPASLPATGTRTLNCSSFASAASSQVS